mmetsp:Transcript_55637/g.89986  ORF Transcript_55637/g.89986 Transcript_55637/m.89986 type:complete len:395 (-) Transcript_55637:188-1372(-)
MAALRTVSPLIFATFLVGQALAAEISATRVLEDADASEALAVNDECWNANAETQEPYHCALSALQRQGARKTAVVEESTREASFFKEEEGLESQAENVGKDDGVPYLSGQEYHDHHHRTCSGPNRLNLHGYGPVQLMNAKWNVPGELAGAVRVEANVVKPSITGRTYFTSSCASSYKSEDFVALRLLGKRFSYMSDVSGTGCGCNAAVYFTSMHGATDKSKCHDYYCDASNVCGANCAEVDVQEANMVAYRATLHGKGDIVGNGTGYGGWAPHQSVWTKGEYGPDGSRIKTTKPYRVSVEFPTTPDGHLTAMTVTLLQEGRSLSLAVGGYSRMQEISKALHAGMTPIISYWKAKDLTWMDGKDRKSGVGPCDLKGEGSKCGEHVKFWDFKLETL